MAYIKRAAEDTITRVSKMFPVLLVTGPRQVGKTTLLQRLAEAQKSEGIDRKYVSLDDPDVRYLAKRDPALFLQRYSPPVLIDEIQYATELFPYIKMSVDRTKRKGDFWITGSQVFRLMKNVSESLAGRVGIVNLLGLSSAEIYGEPRGSWRSQRRGSAAPPGWEWRPCRNGHQALRRSLRRTQRTDLSVYSCALVQSQGF